MKGKIEKALQEQYDDNTIRVVAVVGDTIIVYRNSELYTITVKKVSTYLYPQIKCNGYVKELISLMNSDYKEKGGVLNDIADEYIVVDGMLYQMELFTSVCISNDPELFLGGEFIC